MGGEGERCLLACRGIWVVETLGTDEKDLWNKKYAGGAHGYPGARTAT